MTTLETLKAARAKIADRKNWIQGCHAKNAEGKAVPLASESAVCWCAQGALGAVAYATNGFSDAWIALADSLGPVEEGNPVVEFNDTHTHAEVLALFDKAIASLEAV